ncbi:putative metal-binding motif-containing protein [Myxococcota bacterium]
MLKGSVAGSVGNSSWELVGFVFRDCEDPAIHPGASERCNGVDDDCDETIDDDWPEVGNACSAGVGQCEASGRIVCTIDGGDATCGASPSSPETERCGDEIDNDCDSLVDEDCGDGVIIGGCRAFPCDMTGEVLVIMLLLVAVPEFERWPILSLLGGHVERSGVRKGGVSLLRWGPKCVTTRLMDVSAQHNLGGEFTWLARDPADHIAAFCVKTEGPVPTAIVSEPELADRTYEAVDALAPTGLCSPTRYAEGETYYAGRLAERGVYAYDWNPTFGLYVLISKPTVPLVYTDLRDREARNAIAKILFGNHFATAEALGLENLAVAIIVEAK